MRLFGLSPKLIGYVTLSVIIGAVAVIGILTGHTPQKKADIDLSTASSKVIDEANEDSTINPTEHSDLMEDEVTDPIISEGSNVRLLQLGEIEQLDHAREKWLRSRGYFEKEDYALYASYDDQTVWQLANEGDLLALAILAIKFKRQDLREEALQTELLAAVHGSSQALTSIASSYLVKSWDKNLSDEEKHAHVKRMLVYSETAAMRGDKNGLVSGLLELEHKSIELSHEDIKEIRDYAKRLYAHLEDHRKSLGMSSFDNDADPFMEVQLVSMALELSNPNGWASEFIGDNSGVHDPVSLEGH